MANLLTAAKNGVNALRRTTIANGPKILMIAGGVGIVAGTVLIARATVKTVEDVRNTKEVINDIRQEYDEEIEVTTDKDSVYSLETKCVDEVRKETLYLVGRSVRNYGPGVALYAAGMYSVFKGGNLLDKRLARAVAAYTSLDQGFRAYRRRVREEDEYGEERDRYYRTGIRDGELEYTTKAKNGKEVVKKKKGSVIVDDYGGPSTNRLFQAGNPNFEENLLSYNKLWLENQQSMANDALKSRGFLFLNEVYIALGFPPTAEGAVAGWLYNGDGDGQVSFGMHDIYTHEPGSLLDEPDAIYLDFNIDGVIINNLGGLPCMKPRDISKYTTL